MVQQRVPCYLLDLLDVLLISVKEANVIFPMLLLKWKILNKQTHHQLYEEAFGSILDFYIINGIVTNKEKLLIGFVLSICLIWNDRSATKRKLVSDVEKRKKKIQINKLYYMKINNKITDFPVYFPFVSPFSYRFILFLWHSYSPKVFLYNNN